MLPQNQHNYLAKDATIFYTTHIHGKQVAIYNSI